MVLAKNLKRFFINTFIVLCVILFIPGLPPYSKLEPFSPTPPLAFEGALDPKDYALAKAEKLFDGEIVGPESLEVSPIDPNVFYATLHGGSIIKIFGNGTQMKTVAKLGHKCSGSWDVNNCGRPLGIRFDRDGYLIVADSYLGIYKVDCESSGQVSNLVHKHAVIEGKVARIFNGVAPAKDGRIYYTVTSTNYPFDEALGEMLGAPSGRLMVFNPETNENKVLQENIHFANGILLSPEEDYVIYAECFRFRLHKYFIRGPKTGTTEIFLDGLPGTPDNLNLSPEGNILIALVSVRLPGEFDPLELLFNHPWLRKLAIRIMHLAKFPFDVVSKFYDFPLFRQIGSHVMSLNLLVPVLPPYSIIVEADWEGKIVNSWHSNSADQRLFSDAKIVNGYMYLGSPFNDFLARIKMPSSTQITKHLKM
ncbi:adipocyte plasma membrane-associated protein-like [Daphnia pulex]|uniref:adipocyte plasma membrane-associated protein-like n=1 Tax=Daphnia pulex TaxID=6669 RepID=UPI001EE09679|nr:adipocyte plasma membrane-associated protein-like [Daphnia pulex]